jgi:hypothetical protein
MVNPELKQKVIMFAVVFNIVLAIAMMTIIEGCAIELQTEPIEVDLQVEVTAGLNCKDLDVMDYLDTELCLDIDPNCCEIEWSESCYIYLCDTCIGISEGCYDQES